MMLIVGFVCSKKNNSVGDFYLGGRKLGPLVTAMSAEASDMSSWLLMGLPGLAYASGICDPGLSALPFWFLGRLSYCRYMFGSMYPGRCSRRREVISPGAASPS